MATYYVDDGGDGTTESSWATADTSINALDAEYALASGDIVYFGHDHVCQAVNVASLTLNGPSSSSSNAPVAFISVTQGSSPPTYQASTTAQIDTSEGAYSLNFGGGSFALYGMSVKAGTNILMGLANNGRFYAENSRFALGANGYISPAGSNTWSKLVNCVVDLTADVPTPRSGDVFQFANNGTFEIQGLTFVNPAYRTGTIFGLSGTGGFFVSACDFTGFTNATLCEIVSCGSGSGFAVVNNCITAATWGPTSTNVAGNEVLFTNCGPADDPTYLHHSGSGGNTTSSTGVYRTGGATVEGTACSWLVTTNASCSEVAPYKGPWIHGLVDSTGSKTFTLYITNDTADFTDAQVWIELEYLGTTDEAQYTLAMDRRASLTATAAAQTDDTTSTWNGSGPSYTYKQSLAVTVTVNETGTYRVRVVCGVASVASTRYFYVDPKVTVS